MTTLPGSGPDLIINRLCYVSRIDDIEHISDIIRARSYRTYKWRYFRRDKLPYDQFCFIRILYVSWVYNYQLTISNFY